MFKIKRFYYKLGRDSGDPEKALLPTILFINTKHPVFAERKRRGFLLCFGWWDFSIKIGIFL